MRITKQHFIAPILLGFCLLAPSACAPPVDVPRSPAQIPPIAPGMARVWFLRDKDPQEALRPEGRPRVMGWTPPDGIYVPK